jgi:hypothetical protein
MDNIATVEVDLELALEKRRIWEDGVECRI